MADKETDNDDTLEMEGYEKSGFRTSISWIGIVLTLGVLRLLFYWLPVWYLKATHSKTTLGNAEKILVTDIYEKKRTRFVCHVSVVDLASIRKSNVYANNRDANETCRFVDEQFEAIFEDNSVVYFDDGSYQVLGDNLRLIHIKELPFIWDGDTLSYRRIVGVGPGLSYVDIHNFSQHSLMQRLIMKMVYGDNVMNVPNTPYLLLVLLEMTTPFYIFQYFSALLKGFTQSWITCYIIFGFTFLIIFLSSALTKWNQSRLKKMLINDLTDYKILCDNGIQSVSCDSLVPGDRIILPEKEFRMPCDGILLSGSCLVNESMLTGESVPQSKTSLPYTELEFIEKDLSNHIVYTGTTILRTHSSEPIQVLVIRTGFSTSQGSIVRSILYPRPLDYAFESSVLKFAILVFILSLIGGVINAIVQIIDKYRASEIAINTLSIAVMLIPTVMPILSATKLVGMRRLVKKKIFCINAGAFNLAGTTNCVCFDKTGTLTEDGLDLHKIIPSNNALFMDPTTSSSQPRIIEDRTICKAMAACHSIMQLENEEGVKSLSGDPLDVKMFEWTGWDFSVTQDINGQNYPTVCPKDQHCLVKIIHQNQFSSKLQRMSVVVQCTDEASLRLYCKGSPETIISLSLPHTVPSNFTEILDYYTKQGFRVLGLATKAVKPMHTESLKRTLRNDLETQLEFIGLIAFENKLKQQTTPTIEELKNADYKIVMITGDNQQTAECVAKECGLINQHQIVIELFEDDNEIKCFVNKPLTDKLANHSVNLENGSIGDDYVFSMNGNAWKLLREKYKNILSQVLVKSAVFARMSSDQKKEVVGELSALGYCVVMCGDGANDCGALRAADVGISLSQTEASAAASFTSQVEDISCVTDVIRNGRCSLATSVSFFKFMTLTPIMMTIASRFMQSLHKSFSSGQHTYLESATITNLAVWFPRAGANQGCLPSHIPINNVLSFYVIFSMLADLLVCFSFQVGSFYLVQQFSWYKKPSAEGSYENYTMFCIVAFQLLSLCVVHSPSYPFREPFYKTYTLTIALIALLITGILITIHPPHLFVEWLEIRLPPNLEFPFIVLGFAVFNLIIIVIIEKFLVEKSIYTRCKRYPYLIKTKTKQRFLEIQDQINYNYNWVFQYCNLSIKR